MINTVKGKALEVAEYLTPVLKVSRAGLAGAPRRLRGPLFQAGKGAGVGNNEGDPPPLIFTGWSLGLPDSAGVALEPPSVPASVATSHYSLQLGTPDFLEVIKC